MPKPQQKKKPAAPERVQWVVRLNPTGKRKQWSGSEVPGKVFERSPDPEREDLGWYAVSEREKRILERKKDGDHAGAPLMFEVDTHENIKLAEAAQRQRARRGSATSPIGLIDADAGEVSDLKLQLAKETSRRGKLERLLGKLAKHAGLPQSEIDDALAEDAEPVDSEEEEDEEGDEDLESEEEDEEEEEERPAAAPRPAPPKPAKDKPKDGKAAPTPPGPPRAGVRPQPPAGAPDAKAEGKPAAKAEGDAPATS